MFMKEVGSDEYLNGLKAYEERDFVLAIKLWRRWRARVMPERRLVLQFACSTEVSAGAIW